MTDDPPAPQPLNVKIGIQQHIVEYVPGGGKTSYWQVPFTTASGVSSTVDVPDEDYNPQNVAAIIRETVAKIEGVEKLSSG
jgi:hypothetical protein